MQKNRLNLLKKILWMSVLVPIFFTVTVYGGKTVRIMPLGDSITHGIPPQTENNATGYRKNLWFELNTTGYNPEFVGSLRAGWDELPPAGEKHEGWDGMTDDEMAQNVFGYLEANPAEIVLLHIGTNDIDTAPGAVETILNEIDRYEDKYNPVTVILARIINTVSGNTDITAYNDLVLAMAQDRIDGLNRDDHDDIVIVDMEYGAEIDYTTDMASDLHPNASGYAKMASTWYPALTSVIPAHYWDLHETAAPYIDTYRDANGICVGTCPTPTTGLINGAQKFDGDISSAKVDVPNNNGTFDWEANASFTIEFWMKTDQNAPSRNNVIMGRANASDSWAWFTAIDQSTGQIFFYLRDSSGKGSPLTVGPRVDDTKWHHIVCVRDYNSTDRTQSLNIVYVDGEWKGEVKYDYTADFTEGTPVNLGYLDWDNYFFEGILDDVAFYDNALSAEQIKQHYDSALSASFRITTDPITWAIVGEPYSYDVNSSDGTNVTFDFLTSPSGMNINPVSGLIDWMPSVEGDEAVTVVASSDDHPDTNQDFTIATFDFSQFPSSMTGYWRLDEANGPTYTDSKGTADANCTGAGCPLSAPGQVDGAQKFDGTNKVDIIDTTAFNWTETDSFSIEFWIKTDQNLSNGKPNVFLGRASGTSDDKNDLGWLVGIYNGKLQFWLNDSNGGNVKLIVNKGPELADNQPHHIVCIRDFDSKEIRAYVDGTLIDNISAPYDAGFSITAPVTVGYLIWNGGYSYDGILDEVAVYNSALSEDEIAAHHQNGLNRNGFGDTGMADVGTSTVTATTNNVAADGKATDVLEATILDASSNPVSGETVTFAKTTLVKFSSPTCITGTDGKCSITATSTKAGSYSTAVSITAGTLNDSPVVYTFVADAADATKSTVTATTNDAAANGAATDVLEAIILDASRNPVSGETVTFTATADVAFSSPTCITGTDGKCSITATSTKAGGYSTAVSITAGALNNSPVAYTFVADAADATKSTVTATTNDAAANGAATDVLEAIILDASSNPVSGETVTFAKTTLVKFSSPTCITGTDGKCSITATSTKAGSYSTAVSITAGTLNDSPVVYTFVADAADATKSTVAASPASVEADGSTTSTVTVTVKDANFNPVTNTTVSLAQTGSSTISAVTNAGDGTYTFTVSSTTVELVTYTATADGVTVTQTVDVTFTATTTPPDTTPPIITLNGDNPIDVVQGSTYTDPGATCTDNYDAACTVKTGGDTVDTSTLGSYTVTYDATDASGNAATQVTRTVNVTPYTLTEGGSTVILDLRLFEKNDDGAMITFTQKDPIIIDKCVIQAYIELMSNGDVIAGYENSCGTDTTEYAPGATVIVGNDMVLLIEAEVPEDGIILGDE